MRLKINKWLLVFTLVVSMLVTPIKTWAISFNEFIISGFHVVYNDDRTLTIKSYDGDKEAIGSDTWQMIERTVSKKITAIGEGAFQNNKTLKSIYLPWSVKKIGNNAFDGCSNLNTVGLSDTTSIGANAFRNCSELRELRINSNTTIGKGAFSGCSKLNEITYGGSRYEWKQLVDSGIGVNSKAKVTCKTVKNHFLDVEPGTYYTYAVAWAYTGELTTGVDQAQLYFAPHKTCTRAEVVTFIWRMWNAVEPSIMECPFVDVDENSYYYKALLWAYNRGVVTGKDETHFDPDGIVTRAEFVTMLWRSRGNPPSNIENTFVDVDDSAYYADAVRWAVAKDITRGVGDNMFDPDAKCTRAQTVTFLCRAAKIWGQ